MGDHVRFASEGWVFIVKSQANYPREQLLRAAAEFLELEVWKSRPVAFLPDRHPAQGLETSDCHLRRAPLRTA